METARESSLFVDNDVYVPSAPSSPEIKCEPMDEDGLVPLGSPGTDSPVLAQGLVSQAGAASAATASSVTTVAGTPIRSLDQHRLGPELNTTWSLKPPGVTAPLQELSEVHQQRLVAPGQFAHAAFRPHWVPHTVRRQQRQHRRHHQGWHQQPGQSRREVKSLLDILRQHDPREVTPLPFIQIMIDAAIRDEETAADIQRLTVYAPLHPKAQPQARPASVSQIRSSNMAPNGLPCLQLGVQRQQNVHCVMPPPTAPPATPHSQANHQPLLQPLQQPSSQIHTMPHSQATLQPQTTPENAPQPFSQPTAVSDSPTMCTWVDKKPTSQQERARKIVQDAFNRQASMDEEENDDSSSCETDSEEDDCWLTSRYAGEYGQLSVSEIIKLAAAQQNSPTQHKDSDRMTLVEKSSPLQPRPPGPLPETASNVSVESSPIAPAVSFNVVETKPSSVAPRNPNPQPAGFGSQSIEPSPAPITEDNHDPPSMQKDEPVNFTWLLDQVEVELGWTGKYDKPNKYTETRLRSMAVLAASQVERILKKLGGKMTKHTSLPNRVHILTVMREIVQAVMQTPTTSHAGDEAQKCLARYQSQFLAAVNTLTAGQRDMIKIIEGGKWMRELQDTVSLAEGMGVSGDLEQAVLLIDC
ncbi:hypothetical protein PG996_002157 [Apiospora saccharicola]|uniref:Uncharacterized protein n=1 Tax=Apiospora saccharicola TaxID=335842 RepID=A0ABR1WLN3_9PEZI